MSQQQLENSLRRLLGDTLMDIMVDVPSVVVSCRIIVETVETFDKD